MKTNTMTNIVTAKKELYESLKSTREVTGAGIKSSGQTEYIVIFVRELTDKIKSLIPSTYKGIKVKTEKSGMARIV